MSRSRSRTTAERGLLGLVLGAACAAAAPAAPLPWQAPFAEGDPVRFQGTVAAPDGTPLPAVDVTLEASALKFDWRTFRRVRSASSTRPVQTDANGAFDLEWRWDSSYRDFELVVSVPVRLSGRMVDYELARLDVSDRLRQGSPVASALTAERADFVRGLRAFLDSLSTDDERRAYDQLGLPESVDHVATATGRESAWWYFELGRVARFRDGRLTEVSEFDPVRPIDEEGHER